MKSTSEAAFETAIEAVLLANSYARVDGKGFDREDRKSVVEGKGVDLGGRRRL